MLEEEFFRNRTADFFYMFLVGGTLMSMLAYFVNLIFLGHAFTIMLVYIWSRRNPGIRMNFFGIITFQAPYLPWVLLALSILLGSSTVVDIIGIIVGHFYYFFEDVFPNEPHGFRILETPRIIKIVFNALGIDEPPMQEEDRPEQFNFVNEPSQQQEPTTTPTVPTTTPEGVQSQPSTDAANATSSSSTTATTASATTSSTDVSNTINRDSDQPSSRTSDGMEPQLRSRNVQAGRSPRTDL